MLLIQKPVTFRPAQATDAAAITNLLQSNGLPVSDVTAAVLSGFLLAEDEQGLAGTVAIEVFGPTGLLRSLCTRQDLRGTGLGSALLATILEQARSQKVNRLYLLTESAGAFFAAHGFQKAERADLPAEIKATAQFRNLCPGSAVCMLKELK